jgi:membrane protease subunit (stomatin/prohibitin family)
MALIDVVKWDAPADLLVWKFPNSELSTLTQLIVNESQTAILFKDGQRLDVFGAGRHTLSTNNIPLLNRLVNLPFGGSSPFAAEVWFCNRAIPLDLKWGTPRPLQLEDPQYGLVVPISAFGQMGIRVKDPAVFVGSLVGTMPNFSTHTVLDYFKGVLIAQLTVAIAQAIIRRQVPILQIDTELVTLSEDLQRDLQPHYDRYGLEVQLFRIMSINVPEDDPGVQELKKAKAAVARRKIEGTNYQQERAFDVMQAGASNPGMGGAFAGVGAGLAVGQAIGGMAAQQLGAMGLGVAPTPLIGGPPPFSVPAPATSAYQYYVQVNGQQAGPYRFAQMQQAVTLGQLHADAPVWRDGLPSWATARQVPELATLFPPASPPPGPPPFGSPPPGPPPFGGG